MGDIYDSMMGLAFQQKSKGRSKEEQIIAFNLFWNIILEEVYSKEND